MATPDSLSSGWFDRAIPPPESEPVLIESIRPRKAEGRLGWALFFGAVGGAVGGVAMMYGAQELSRRFGLDADVIGTIGGAARRLGVQHPHASIATGAGAGAVVGMAFGALMRHSLRLRARVLTGVLLAPVLWTLLQAFVFPSFWPSLLVSLPFGPMAGGAALFGACVAILPPPRRKPAIADDA